MDGRQNDVLTWPLALLVVEKKASFSEGLLRGGKTCDLTTFELCQVLGGPSETDRMWGPVRWTEEASSLGISAKKNTLKMDTWGGETCVFIGKEFRFF